GIAHLPSLFYVAILLLPFVFGIIITIEGYWGGYSLMAAIVAAGLSINFWHSFLMIPLAAYDKYLELQEKRLSIKYYPSLTVIVPAYNEEKVIARTIEALLDAEYPDKEIIVVDDGSTDGTLNIALRYEKLGVKVLHKENGGKYSALNYGLRAARGDIVVVVDADTIVGRKALKAMAMKFREPDVAAVCGNIKVLNRVNWLTKCQALEYVLGINIVRRALSNFGAVPVVPGSLGAFRRSVLETVGFYDKDTVVEDFDVTIKVLKAGRSIQASSEALAYTEAPQTFRDFYKQRMRWYGGNLQTIIKHKDALFNPRYGFLQRLSYPYVLVSLVFIPFASVVVWIAAAYAIIAGEGALIALIFSIFTTMQFLLSLLALEIDEEDLKLMLYSPFFVIGYKNLIDFFKIKSMLDIVLRRRVKWMRAERIGYAEAIIRKRRTNSTTLHLSSLLGYFQ
ncbi:MAG: glycosyl transferase, partial [Thermoprotei archaeon]